MATVEQLRRAAAARARAQAAAAGRGAARGGLPADYWRRSASPLRHVGEEEFRVWAYRRGRRNLLLGGVSVSKISGKLVERWGGLVESLSWVDEVAILVGDIQLRREPYGSRTPDVVEGDEIRLEYRARLGGAFTELWRMRVRDPAYGLRDGTIRFSLRNDLGALDDSTDDFKYVKKAKQRGFLVAEIVADVCRRYGVRAKLTRTRHRTKKQVWLADKGPPWEFLKHLRNVEETYTGRKLFYRWNRGRLELMPFVRSAHLLILGPTLMDAALQKTRRENFATALTLRTTVPASSGKDAKGHQKATARKLAVTFRSKAAADRYGVVHRILYSPDANSRAELLQQAKLFIAEVLKPKRELTLSHPGIATLRRGHAAFISLPEAGLKQIVFVTRAAFQLGPGSFSMDLTCMLEDPFVDQRELRILDKLTDTPGDRKSERVAKKTKPKPKPKPKPERNNNRAAKAPAAPRMTDAERLRRRYGG